ncbi:MAG: hypothetical protein GEU73_04820 [Chloroflexi bacterium]|nr:hypothetical protein [Chloroflexota bacterium]
MSEERRCCMRADRPDAVEVLLRKVRVGPGDEPAAAIVAPRDPADGCALCIDLGHREAQTLAHELQGGETSRGQALVLVNRVAELLQGAVVGAFLLSCRPGCLRAAIRVRTPSALVELPTEPGQALAAALLLQIPLLADRKLFERGPTEPPSINGSLAAFLDTLDVSCLTDEGD